MPANLQNFLSTTSIGTKIVNALIPASNFANVYDYFTGQPAPSTSQALVTGAAVSIAAGAGLAGVGILGVTTPSTQDLLSHIKSLATLGNVSKAIPLVSSALLLGGVRGVGADLANAGLAATVGGGGEITSLNQNTATQAIVQAAKGHVQKVKMNAHSHRTRSKRVKKR